ncbi:MAG: hypothetical protein IPL84_01830 [Chitinophagaceae bacterium]|nr:hypothetical protein [Chitinophagaceae bacterium]
MKLFYTLCAKLSSLLKNPKCLLTMFLFGLMSIGTVNAQSVTLSTTIDENDGNTASIAALIGTPGGAGISLREAILAANNEPVGSTVTITMPVGTFPLTITGAAENVGVSGDIDVNSTVAAGMKTVTINGAGSGSTVISGAGLGERVFDVHAINNAGSITFNLSGVTISGASIASASGGAMLLGRPGDISNISNCIFSGNSAPNSGAISQSSSLAAHDLTVTNCTFTNNTATTGGPGALNYNGIGNVTITGCTFSGNTATTSGGAVNITGGGSGPVTANILNNTFLNNTANGTQFGGAAVAITNAQTVNINFNRLFNNTSPNLNTALPPNNGDGRVITASGGVIGSLNVDNNWWGVNTGPVTTATSRSVFGAAPTRWLNLSNTAAPASVCVGATSTITASFLANNLSEAIAPANLTALVGQPITFNTPVNGTLSAAQTTIQAAGTATVTFTATTAGGGSANAVFVPATENFTVTTSPTITVNGTNTAAAPSSNPTVCINTAISPNITIATTGATGIGAPTGLPAGVSANWAGNVITISGTPTTTVGSPFNYSIPLTGGCGTVNATGAITVNPTNTVSLSSAVGTDAQTVNVNTAITNITYATTGATGATFSGLPAGVTGSWSGNVATITGSPTTAVGSPFNYTVTLTGGCGTVTATGTITVTTCAVTLTSAAGTDAQSVCNNTAITNITYATVGATGATFSGLPPGVTGNWVADVVTISGTPTAIAVYNYTVTQVGGACNGTVANGTITVNGTNTVTLSSAAGTDAQTVCINTPITNITYATTVATGATVTGLPAGVTGSWAANVVTISGTPTVAGAALTYTVTLTGGCGGPVTATGTIAVTANNTITLSSAAGTNAQTVCINTPITNITYTTTGATGATVTGLPAGVSGSWAANVVTISGTPTVAGAALTYTVTLTGGCGAITATGTIAVTANNTVTLTSAAGTNAQTVCVNTPITPITYTTTGATGATVTGLPAGVSGAWAANVVTISGTPTASGAALTYTITLTGGCGTISTTGTITVNPNNTATLSSAAGTDAQTVVVLNPIVNITYATTGATGATVTGLPAGVTGSWAANVVTISGTPTAIGSFNYTVNLTGGCGMAFATGNINVIACLTNTWTGTSSNNWFTPGNWSCGVVPTAPMDVVIPAGTPNPCVVAAATTAQLHNFTINAGAVFTNNGTVNINGGGVVSNCGTYQGTGTFTGALFSNTCATAFVRPGSSPGCTIFGAGYTNGSGTEVIEIGGTTVCTQYDQLQVVGTATLSGTLDVQLFGGFIPSCGQSFTIMTANTVTGTFASILYPAIPAGLSWNIQYNATSVVLSITGTPTATATPASQTTCSATPITTIVLNGSPIAATTYNWTRDNAGTVTGIAASGSGDISGTLTNLTNIPITVTFTITPVSGSCTGASITATVIVNPTPDVNQPANQVVCNGAPTAAVTFTGTVPGTVFNWTNSDPTIGLAATGTGDIASFNAVNTGTAPVVATVTVTPSYTSGGGPGGPVTFTNSTNILIPPGQPGTSDGNAAPYPSSIVVSGLPVTGVGVESITLNNIQHTWSADVDVLLVAPGGQHFVPMTDVGGSTGFDALATITIQDGFPLLPLSNAVIATGTYAPTSNTVGNAGNIGGVWTAPAPVGPYNYAAPLGASTFASVFNTATDYNGTWNLFINDDAVGDFGNIAGGWSITLVTPAAGTTCTGPSKTFTYTVNPTATVNPIADRVRCYGSTIGSINFSSPTTGGTIVYNWTNDAPSIGIPASGSGNIPNTRAINTSNIPVVATITVTPAYTNGGTTCNGTPMSFTITVNPTPNFNNATLFIPGTLTLADPVYHRPEPYLQGGACVLALIPGEGTAVHYKTHTFTLTAPSNVTVSLLNSDGGNVTPIGRGQDLDPFLQLVGPAGFVPGAACTNSIAANDDGGALPNVRLPRIVTTTPLAAGTYTIVVTSWDNTPGTVAVTDVPLPWNYTLAVHTTSQTVCDGALTAPLNFTTTVPGTVFDWTNNDPSIGLAASGSGSIASFTATNATTAPVTATITVSPTYTNAGVTCSGAPILYYITVNPTPNATASPASQTICSGAAITPIALTGTVPGTVFNWVRDNNATVTGIAASGTVTPISGNLTNTTNIPITVTFTITPSYTNAGVTCTGTPVTATVVVNPTPTVNPVANQVVCNNSPTTAVTFTGSVTAPPGTVYNWTNTQTSIGLAASGSGNIASFTAINTGTAPVVATITVTPSYTNAGTTCNGTPTTFTITVNPTPTAIATPAAQTVCSGAPITPIVLNSGAGGTWIRYRDRALTGLLQYSGAFVTAWRFYLCCGSALLRCILCTGTVYNWVRDNPVVTGIPMSGSGSPISGTLTNPTNTPITVTFTITPSYTNGGITCTGAPVTATVVVNPIPDVNQPANQVVCNGSPTAIVVFTGSVTSPPGTVYTWTNNTPSIGLAAGPLTGNIPSFTAINNGTAPVVATITVTPSYTNGGVTCTGSPKTFTITVNPTPQVTVPANAVVCNGTLQPTGTYNFTTTATGGVTTYAWSNNNINIGLGGTGTGNSLPTFTATNTTNAPITGTITVTATYTNGGVSCTGPSNSFTITVNPTPNATATPASQTICSGAAITTIVNSGTVAGTVFNWTRDNVATATGIAASGTGNISGTLTNTTTGPVLVTFTITPSYTNGGVTCTGPTTTATVLVNPTATVNPVANQVVCNGAPTAAVTFSSPTTGGTIVYNWTNSLPSIGLAAAGVGNIASFIATNPANTPVTATITVTPTYTNGGISCVGTPISFTITVNPTPEVNQPANQTVCTGSLTAPVLFVSTSVGGTVVFNWTNNNITIGLAAAGVGDIPAFTALNGTNAPNVGTITVTPVFTNGGVSCTGPSKTFTITVNPTPVVNPVANQTVCAGSPTAAVTFSSPATGGTIVYNWTNSNTAIGLVASGTGNIASFIATNATAAPITGTITVTATYTNNGVSCTGPSMNFTITVDPYVTVNPVANQTVCTGSPTAAITFSSPSSPVVFNWTNSNPTIGLAAAGVGNIASFIGLNGTNAPNVGTIVVTPTYTGGGASCPGVPLTFTITVNPIPVVNPVPNQAVCNGSPTSAVVFTSPTTGGTMTYNWTNSNTAIGLGASGVGPVPSFIGTNPGTAPISGTITVTPTYTNNGVSCTGSSISFTITVNPVPTVNPVANQVVCNGAPTAAIIFTGAVPGTVYNWINVGPNIGLGPNGTGNIPSFIASNPGTVPLTATITVIPTYTNAGVTCQGAPITFTITVNPTPTVNPVASQTHCNGSPTLPVTFSGTVAGTVFTWTNNNTSIGLGANGVGNIPSFIAINTGTTVQVATITVTPTYTNGGVSCTGPTTSFTITVNPIPTVNPVTSFRVCGGAPVTVNFTGAVTGTVFNWTNNNIAIGLAASGTGNLNFIATNTSAIPIFATITVTPTFTNGGVTCTGASTSFTITVNPTPTVNQQANQVLCTGSATAPITFTGTASGAFYTWTNNQPSIGLGAAGVGDIPSFTALNAGITPVVATVTVTPIFIAGGVTCTGPTMSFTITVNPNNTIVLTAGGTPASTTLTGQINNTDPTTNLRSFRDGVPKTCAVPGTCTAPLGGTFQYDILTWTNPLPTPQCVTVTYSIPNANPNFSFVAAYNGPVNLAALCTNWLGDPGSSVAVGNTIVWSFTAPGNANINFLVTNIANGQVADYRIVLDYLLPGGGSNNQTVCQFTPIVPIIYNTTGATGASFSGLPPGVSGNWAANVATISGTPTAVGVFNYTVNLMGGCGSVSATGTITVNSSAVMDQPGNQLVCNGANTSAVVFTGLPPGTTYSWTNNNTSIGLAASGTGNIPSFVATNATATVQTATITVTSNSTGCGGTTVSFTITVQPTPTVNQPANQTLCAGNTTVAVPFSGAVTGTVYTWTNNNTTIGLGASGIGTVPAFVAINATLSPITATITVTPTYTNAGITCTGASRSFTITVNPLPNIVFDNVPPRVCLTDTVVILKVSPAGGTWSGTGVTGNTFSATSAGLGVHVLRYSFTNGNGCTQTSYFNITVNDCKERHNIFATAIRIYPNPNSGYFNIRFNSDIYSEFNVRVIDAIGRVYRSQHITGLRYGSVIPMAMPELAAGTYFLEIYNETERAQFPMVIVR